jgi:hypothetical protein
VFLFTFMDGMVAAWDVCSSALSYGLGPLVFGLATDYVFGAAGLRSAISLCSLPIILLGLALSWFGRRPYDRARLASAPNARVDRKWLELGGLPAAART